MRHAHHFLLKDTEFPSARVKNQFWLDQGVGAYDPSHTKASRLRDPLLRIVHRCLVYSISGRGNGDTVVNLRELFYMYCLVQPQACNLAHSIAWYFLTSPGRDATSWICGGHLVTVIAKFYGLLSQKHLGGLTAVAETKVIKLSNLKNMHITQKTQSGLRLVDQWGRVWDPDRPATDPDRVVAEEEAQASLGGHVGPGADAYAGPDSVVPPQQKHVVIPLSELHRFWTWMYETHLASVAATGVHVQIPVPYFMQPVTPRFPRVSPVGPVGDYRDVVGNNIVKPHNI
ncbi:hypothetical protein Hdeb2414_s0005g00174721 [Helianthus debilis subsp. tardiflorus]